MNTEYRRNMKHSRRNKLIELSGGKCNRCDSITKLEFNHISTSTKLFGLNVGNMARKWSVILDEHKKCELLCYVCHLENTRLQWKTGEIVIWNKGKTKK
jgi:hypothetical protein